MSTDTYTKFAAVGLRVYAREYYPAATITWTITYLWEYGKWSQIAAARYPGLNTLNWQDFYELPDIAQQAAIEFLLQ